MFLKRYVSIWVGIAAATAYGVITRGVFGRISDISGPLSLSFFLFAPGGLGFLTVILATNPQKSSWWYAIFAPWIACSICMVIAGAFLQEAWFCVLLAMPLFLVLASLGGVIACLVWRLAGKSKGITLGALVLFAATPYLAAPLEAMFPVHGAVRRVHSQIEINAPAELVWGNITNLAEIGPSERRWAFFHLVGLPRPIQARMACEQVGCVRRGEWEDGLAFDGSITRIEPGRSYWVSLKADTRQVNSSMAPINQIGGPFFDMIDDGYEIESLGGGRSVLHLYSTYRLTTRINLYGVWWTDLLMRDIQGYILDVEKARSEKG